MGWRALPALKIGLPIFKCFHYITAKGALHMPDFKSFFETPKKARITVICMAVALATLGAIIAYIIWAVQAYGGADAPPAPSETLSAAPARSQPPGESATDAPPVVGMVPTLTMDQARELALADAGVAEGEAEFSREALAEDNGIWVYEFRFATGEARYEYKLNANTGEVRGMVKETFAAGSAPPSVPAGSVPPAETAPQPSAAVQSAPPESTPSPAPSQAQSTMYIGMDRAKAIALEHAGLTASQVRFTHTRMDREDGVIVYEVEFRQGQTEYEYEIDAAIGRILDFEREAH